MKKIIVFLLLAAICLPLVACGNGFAPDSGSNITSSGDNSGSQNPPTGKPFSIDLDGYVANIGNATALGIAKERASTASPVMAKSGIVPLSLFTFLANEDSESKNYIVMSTTEYGTNTPEANQSGLTKVTFTKTVTENVTTETSGTKYITASEGRVTILAVAGFTYTVYENGTLLYEAVQDNDATDASEQDGVIVLDGLTDGTEYRVDYKGVGEEITVTQDEIDGEIDKLYSLYGYTFISFVPKGQSRRPSDNKLVYDYDGVSTYDKSGYCSNSTRQSFVIDNATGLVYLLENFSIDIIRDGLIVSGEKYYDMQVSDAGDLNFIQVIRNETISVRAAFKDKYGNKFVQNDYLNGYDEENRTLYYTKPVYFLSKEGIALHFEAVGDVGAGSFPGNYTVIEKIGAHFSAAPLSKTDSFTINRSHEDNSLADANTFCTLSHVEDGYLYYYVQQPTAYTYFMRVDVTQKIYIEGNYSYFAEGRYFGTCGSGGWDYDCLKSAPIDANTVLIWSDWSGTPTLYYGDVWGDKAIQYNRNMEGTVFETENATVLLANCTSLDWSYDLAVLRFRYTTFTQTLYYRVIIDENGVPRAVNSETYVAPEREVVTLQPLNK